MDVSKGQNLELYCITMYLFSVTRDKDILCLGIRSFICLLL